jgi:1-acyl-sn-glycerol-3-phosphate acyltransferase
MKNVDNRHDPKKTHPFKRVRMTLQKQLIISFFKALTSTLCRIDDTELRKVPKQGPLIMITNHINMVEAPVLYTRLQPRPISGFVAAYRWESLFFRWLLTTMDAIPLHRGTADLSAIRQALQRLKQGDFLVIAPEGTRSRHGRLQRGHAGSVLLALHSGAPIQPIVCYGNERFNENLRRLRRTEIHLKVGEPFRLNAGTKRVTPTIRQEMVDAMMYRLASLLPPRYRGLYADLGQASEDYIQACT